MKKDPLIEFLAREHTSPSQQIYKEHSRYKDYERFPSVQLKFTLEPVTDQMLVHALNTRKSIRNFVPDSPVLFSEFSRLLKLAAGTQDPQENPSRISTGLTRVHPSGGAKYPVETYVLILNVENLLPGIYHYNVKSNLLERLVMLDENVSNLHAALINRDSFIEKASFVVLFSFIKSRSMQKYGGLAYKLAMLEAGHISQNFYLLCSLSKIGCCGLGMSDPTAYNSYLKLDGINETIFYGMAFGLKDTD